MTNPKLCPVRWPNFFLDEGTEVSTENLMVEVLLQNFCSISGKHLLEAGNIRDFGKKKKSTTTANTHLPQRIII